MPIRPGLAADLPQIRTLLRGSRSYLNGGLEDLPALLSDAVTMAGEDDQGRLWGFVAFQRETREETLPPSAPDRVSLRAAAVRQSLLSAQRLPALLNAALAALRASLAQPVQISALTTDAWLISSLQQVGFQEVDQIRFYLRTRRDVPLVAEPAQLRPVVESDLEPLARLDSQTFAPLWHVGRAYLYQLCFTTRIQVAEYQGTLAGYTATAVHANPDSSLAPGEAQIVRLAVHPALQRHGIGRQLLVDAIRYAHAQSVYRIQLNTQESNRTAHHLYEAFHFRRQGRNVSVLALDIHPAAQHAAFASI